MHHKIFRNLWNHPLCLADASIEDWFWWWWIPQRKQLAQWLYCWDSEISSQTLFYTRNILVWGGRCRGIWCESVEDEAARSRSWKARKLNMERRLHWSNPQGMGVVALLPQEFYPRYLSLVARLVVLIPITSASAERVFSQVKFIIEIETIGESGLQETLELVWNVLISMIDLLCFNYS